MKFIYAVLVIFILSTVIAVLTLNSSGNPVLNSSEFNEEFTASIINEPDRNIELLDISLVTEIDLFKQGVYNPVIIKTYNKDIVYILDHNTKIVTRFNVVSNTKEVIYGNGFGEGPGESKMVSDFDVSDNGDVLLVDPSQGKISVFSENGDFLEDLKMNVNPYRVAAFDDFLIIGKRVPNSSMFAKLQKNESKVSKEFGQLLKNHQQTSMAIDGTLRRYQNGFIYISVYSSFLLHFDLDGNLKYNINMVDGIDLPDILSGGQGSMSINSPMIYRKVKVIANSIYVFAAIQEDGGFNRYLDIYDLDTGSYQSSLLLEGLVTDIEIDIDRYYLIDGNGNLRIYKY